MEFLLFEQRGKEPRVKTHYTEAPNGSVAGGPTPEETARLQQLLLFVSGTREAELVNILLDFGRDGNMDGWSSVNSACSSAYNVLFQVSLLHETFEVFDC